MAQMEPPKSLMVLPNELLLQVVCRLQTIRSFDPQSRAFRDREKEKTRQRDNHQRQYALHALTLTSKPLRDMALSTLYAAFTGASTIHGLKRLRLFARTLSERPCYHRYLQYIEVRQGDYLGNALFIDFDDDESPEAPAFLEHYYALLAMVIRAACDLRHLSIASLEYMEFNLWQHLLHGSNPSLDLPKLETLCLQLHAYDSELSTVTSILNALRPIHCLKAIYASSISLSTSPLLLGVHQNLGVIDLCDCMVDVPALADFVTKCQAIKHLGCHWNFLHSQGTDLFRFCTSLSAHQNTLEYLHLDTREIRLHEDAGDYPIRTLGSLRHFKVLRSVELSETSLSANEKSILDVPGLDFPLRISNVLPDSVETFAMLLNVKPRHHKTLLDGVRALENFADDCRLDTALPNLKNVEVRCGSALSTLQLGDRFKDINVDLVLTTERLRGDFADSSHETALISDARPEGLQEASSH
ncbi:hypothetical protein K491DRAFT_720086 [Lophiostoma macrostomum CBS 122681]|uniref:F-box domain-containing protein n=1 Tax=Lophiostoma macrostomum CBS 122681 TaxID=1314788 RepID=A0A6A6SX23_9PLEO|nr:hypothetical protein K491DRAFT_720086 [Lophiostoma macrostomum CBS 122681]